MTSWTTLAESGLMWHAATMENNSMPALASAADNFPTQIAVTELFLGQIPSEKLQGLLLLTNRS